MKKNKSNKPTMKDVARNVGVSVQTVSAVINNKPGITNETSEKVFMEIDRLGYRPFPIARSLRTKRTNTVALIVSDIVDPYFAAIASAAEDLAHSFLYSLVIYNTHDNPEREADYIQTISERWIDGVLIASACDQTSVLEGLINNGIPFVAIDRIAEGYKGPSVMVNNYKGGELAAQHLIDFGHNRLAHICGPKHLRLSRERLAGFQNALEANHLPECLVVNADVWSCMAGYVAFKKLLMNKPRPTAIFAASDRLAIGAIHAANQEDIRIPEDISIVGFDDIEIAEFFNPSLTTIPQPRSQIATSAMQILLSLLNDEKPENTQVVIEPHLIARASTSMIRTLS